MADFVAVLKKTIEGLGETTPDVRDKVYKKARVTIGVKLAALNPPASPAVVDRQRKALEQAIRQVEAEYAAIDSVLGDEVEDPLDELDALFSSLSKPAAKAPTVRETPAAAKPEPTPPPPPPQSRPAAPASTAPVAIAAAAPPPPPQAPAKMQGFRPVQTTPGPANRGFAPAPREPEPEDYDEPDYTQDDEHSTGSADAFGAFDDTVGAQMHDGPKADPMAFGDQRFRSPRAAQPELSRKRSGTVKIAAGAAAALIVFGGLGYGLWASQDRIASLFDGDDAVTASRAPDPVPAPTPARPAAADEQEEEVAVLSPEPDAADDVSGEDAPDDAAPKFTQRLTADGSEIDDGPAGGVPVIGEGTSMAAATQAAAAPETAAPVNEASVPVGQRAIFYEERTSVAQGSAEPGATVWSLIQVSPGNDLPPEPAIRAEASVPGKNVKLLMTIRRNADKSLPASHIVELIFITPDNFAGGTIDNVLRMTMKETEESAGSPLSGMTAKIDEGIFLLALSDEKQALDSNNALLRRQNWIDVPIVYKSGRRALITMEKGVPGEQIFEQALRAWQEASSG